MKKGDVFYSVLFSKDETFVILYHFEAFKEGTKAPVPTKELGKENIYLPVLSFVPTCAVEDLSILLFPRSVISIPALIFQDKS